MNNEGSNSEFFSAGGTLPPDSASYVKRAADNQLLSLTKRGKFCYVLTASQMGKSSLMIRTSTQLRSKGVKTAIIDLTQIGIQGITIEQWYLSLLEQLQGHLPFTQDASTWWEARQDKSSVHLFTSFLRQVVLTEITEPIVIFIDEIGRTLDFKYRDDFFAAIRAMYNARAHDPEFNRVTFVLLGIASPSDLIKDPIHTPFGIATPIALEDFSQKQAVIFQEQLESVFGNKGKIIFDKIYNWTNGHPYLTQKLCRSVVDEPNRHWEKHEIINTWLAERFQKKSSHQDENLKWVEKSILKHPKRYDLLTLYKKIYQGKKVPDDPQSIIHNQLKLSGLVKIKDGYLHLRNNIYKLAFDLEWIERYSSKEEIEDEDEDETSLLEALLILLGSLSRYRAQTAATVAMLLTLIFFANSIIEPGTISPVGAEATPPTQVISLSPTISSSPTPEIVVRETQRATIIPTSTATLTITPTETRRPTLTATESATATLTATETTTTVLTATQTATATQITTPSANRPTALPIIPSKTVVEGEDDTSSELPTEGLLSTNTPVAATVAVATQTPVVAIPTVATQTPVVATPTVATQTPVVATATPTVATQTPVVATPTVATQTPVVATATVAVATQTPVPATVAVATQTPVPATVAVATQTPISPTATVVPPPTTSPAVINFPEVTGDPGLIEATETPTNAGSSPTTGGNNGEDQSGNPTEPSQPSSDPTEEPSDPPEPVPDPPEPVPDPPED